jgi:hypothetical protein
MWLRDARVRAETYLAVTDEYAPSHFLREFVEMVAEVSSCSLPPSRATEVAKSALGALVPVVDAASTEETNGSTTRKGLREVRSCGHTSERPERGVSRRNRSWK